MTIIPKIKLSSGRKREKVSLLTDSQTTANFGFVQPTFAREMIPNSKFEVKVNTRVLNAPMPVPTYGRLSLEHRHVFVPYVDVCPQFNSFLAAQSYKPGSGESYVPNQLVPFKSAMISQYVLSCMADWSVYVKIKKDEADIETDEPSKLPYGYEPITLDGDKQDATKLAFIKQIYNVIFNNNASTFFYGRLISSSNLSYARHLMPNSHLVDESASRGVNHDRIYGNWLLGGWMYTGDNSIATTSPTFSYQDYDTNPNGLFFANPDNELVTIENADFISKFGGNTSNDWDLVIAFKLRPSAKAFRSILLGLGYQFTPNLATKVDNANWLKLFAYYKSWFNLYRPKRELSFTNTTCYNLIKIMEASDATSQIYKGSTAEIQDLWLSDDVAKFINSLCFACQYYLPQDYFGMSVLQPNQNYQDVTDNNLLKVFSGTLSASGDFDSASDARITFSNHDFNNQHGSVLIQNPTGGVPTPFNAQMFNMALKVLKYVNKNTIVGRSIHDYIKAHFGVSLDNSHDLESVYEIGRQSMDITIQPVTSTADTTSDSGNTGDYLGSYAARGFGYDDRSKRFIFENRENFGVWITLSVVIPKSGYYQGILRENMALKRYDFFTPEFDALGYDVLLRDELSADYPTQVGEFNQVTDSSFDLKKAFGFVPRYSHYKVGRNIVSGDLSLRGYRNQYEGYYLDRKIPYEQELSEWIYVSDEQKNLVYKRITKPAFVPTVVYDNFRRIDPNDRLGNYNRIFYSTSVTDDHFIISSTFDVDAWLPAKSLSESFDTFDGEDGKVIDVTHS